MTKNHGQVNGTIAPRSPGSALKPFIYRIACIAALSHQAAYSTPSQSIITSIGLLPVNYDQQHRGYVTVQEALTKSLSVPAIYLRVKLGNNGIYSFLKQAGISNRNKRKAHYGLSLILGSAEIQLIELTNLYASLANHGRIIPYKISNHQHTNNMPRKRGNHFGSS